VNHCERMPVCELMPRANLIVLTVQLQALHTMITDGANEASKRLQRSPFVLIGASAIAATIYNAFQSRRDFATWIGFVPRQDSTGKQKLGPISTQGDRYLRRILVVGAHSVLGRARPPNPAVGDGRSSSAPLQKQRAQGPLAALGPVHRQGLDALN
jgi:transposase